MIDKALVLKLQRKGNKRRQQLASTRGSDRGLPGSPAQGTAPHAEIGAAHGISDEKARDCDGDKRDAQCEARPTHD